MTQACGRDQPCTSSGRSRAPASAASTFTDGRLVPSSVEPHFVSDSLPPNRRCWQATSCLGLRFRQVGSYSNSLLTTCLHRVINAPTSEHHAFRGCARALRRPSPYCAEPRHPRRGHTCSLFAWCAPSRTTSASHQPSRAPRNAIAGGNRVHRVCRAVLSQRLGARTTLRTDV